MDINAVFTGLANGADTIAGLNCFAYAPDAVPPPAFFPFDVDIDFDKAFARGMDALIVRCRLLVSHADDRSGQKALKEYLAGSGSKSIKQALEADRTLGGACHDIHVQRATGYGLYEHALNQFFGAEFTALVIGSGV
ncbi:MAG TPA: hypothetical protein VGX25_04750 [Actinophytocola sp.]|uniref:hypothetical protein n=1 Tax=Actinophytocola sp. TaxID=1872138 RepID=UPI002DDD1E51|nr:hypothetical protein [Actinophytocola sp.]HEV2778691.1 hypothetical protein [Actinophytocola sp.]